MPIAKAYPTASAVGLRERLTSLERERATARLAGLAANDRYMADLLAEVDATRRAYVGAAVTEIAALRASLDGPLFG